MRIRDVKDHLHDPHVLEVLSHCLYKPAEVKSYADRYASDPDIRVFSCVDNGRVLGVMVLKRQAVSLFEIVGIAVAPAFRGRGIGSELIAFAVHHLPWNEIRAETDDGAVGFYRRCGFHTAVLGEKYPGVVRYLCTLQSV